MPPSSLNTFKILLPSKQIPKVKYLYPNRPRRPAVPLHLRHTHTYRQSLPLRYLNKLNQNPSSRSPPINLSLPEKKRPTSRASKFKYHQKSNISSACIRAFAPPIIKERANKKKREAIRKKNNNSSPLQREMLLTLKR